MLGGTYDPSNKSLLWWSFGFRPNLDTYALRKKALGLKDSGFGVRISRFRGLGLRPEDVGSRVKGSRD